MSLLHDVAPGAGGRGIHDLGGTAGGPVDRTEHEREFWEKRVDALMVLLTRQAGGENPVMRVDELRRGVEGLGADAYDRLSYYERWICSIVEILTEKGVLGVDELGRKMAEIARREEP